MSQTQRLVPLRWLHERLEKERAKLDTLTGSIAAGVPPLEEAGIRMARARVKGRIEVLRKLLEPGPIEEKEMI